MEYLGDIQFHFYVDLIQTNSLNSIMMQESFQ